MRIEVVAAESFEGRLRREARERKMKFFGPRVAAPEPASPVVPVDATAAPTSPHNAVVAEARKLAGELLPGLTRSLSTIDIETGKHRPSLQLIIAACARQAGLTVPELLGFRRTAVALLPRQIGMYLAKKMTLASLPEIGRRFGGRDHTTVLRSVAKIERLLPRDADLAARVDLIKKDIENAVEQAARAPIASHLATKGLDHHETITTPAREASGKEAFRA
jgi:chromosomal replication initiator protein